MRHPKIIPAALAALIALGGTSVAFAATGEHENGQEIAAVLGAKTSLSQAIATAEQQNGGRAMKIGVEEKKGAYLYEVKVLSKNKVTEMFIDSATGQVVKTRNEGLIAKLFDREDRVELAKLTTSPTTLAAAVATAEQQVGGKAVEAGVEDKDGNIVFKVQVAKDKTVQKVTVDAMNGKVLQVAASEEGEQDED
ncbi:MAG: PepSY domain-containing protein [Alphaproteobacteria bacterium]